MIKTNNFKTLIVFTHNIQFKTFLVNLGVDYLKTYKY